MEFLNYKVDLTLNEGTKVSGTISHVDSQSISLNDVLQSSLSHANKSSEPIDVKLSNLQVDSNKITDLKVIQLPHDLLKVNGKGNKHKNNNNNSNPLEQYARKNQDVSLLDDAIVFAKPASSSDSSEPSRYNKPSDDQASRSKTSSTPRGGQSRSNTPRLGASKIHRAYSTTGSVDPEFADVDDIKNSNDFDFAANLAMFDKKSVFADFHKNDNVSLQNRLVGHNKLDNLQKEVGPNNPHRSHTPKKDKYDNDEMVLDVNKTDNWDLIGNLNKRLGRQSNGSSRNNSTSNLAKDQVAAPVNKTFKLVHGGHTIPLSSPVQLVEVERLAAESYGITASILAEVCAANLSALITSKILGGSTRLSSKKNHNLPPLVLLLIGSSRCGSRAFATGRHLTNHGIRVLAYVINNEESDSELSQQWELFENVGGKVITSSVPELINILTHELETPVELIVDALQGYDDHLEDIFYQQDDLQAVSDIIAWCNEPRQRNKIMSLDTPSGIDGGSGTVSEPSLVLRSHWIVSMGLPITGLIHAYKNGHLVNDGEEVVHYLVDIGIPNKVYTTKGNLRKFDKFWHSAEFSIKLEISTD